MASREELDKQYVDFTVKLSDRCCLRSDSDILGMFNLEIFTVSEGAIFTRQFACQVCNFGFVVLKLF